MRKRWEDSIIKFEKSVRRLGDGVFVTVRRVKKDKVNKVIVARVSFVDVKKKKRETFENRKYDIKFLKKMK
jgi:hypothetical protein